MKNTHSGLQMDPVSTLKRNQSITLRSTRRIYKKWGIKYHAAVRDAVFMMHSMPLVPLKPPASLKCDNEESDLVYVCQQCRDCFWFKSSFEDHSQRHSWILGFWCQKCFLTVCTHVPNSNSPCDLCVNIERDKRSYMRKKGIHKHQKMGTIRVFYNQCQFFAHLRLHNMSLVNICDIMLMPLPNMEIDWTPKLDTACEALLEYCFMKRVHIMDWFRAKNVDHNWWQLVESNIEDNDNPITKILKTYNGSNLFNSDIAKVDADLIPLAAMYRTSSKSSTVGLTKIALEKNEKDYNKNIKNISSVTTGSSVPNQDTDEDEDNPCSPTDITFVDCDSTYNTYGPFADYSSRNSKMTNSKYMQYIKNNTQSTVNKKQSKKKKLKKEVVNYITSVSSSPNRSSNFISTKEFSNQNLEKDISYMQKDLAHKCSGNAKLSTVSINTQNGSVDNIIKKSITKNANLLPNLSHKGIMNQEYQKQNYLSVLKNDSNLLTFQGTDSVKMNGLIAQIPSHLRANNKILFIGQDMDGVNKKANHAILDAKFREKDIKTMSTKLKSLHMCNNAISSEDNKNTSNLSKIAIESNKTKIHQIPLESKIMYRNGSRYVIAHTSNFQSSTPTSPDSSNNMQIVRYNTKNQNGVTKLTSVENTYLNLSETNVSLPTPSPSSSELSNSSSCEAQRKQNLSIACTQKGLETSRNHLKPKFKHSILDLLNDDVLCETLSFRRAENAEIYLNIKRTKSSTKQLNVVTTVTIPNCRQDMLNEFRQLNSPEIKERILHLQNVRTEILQVMNFAGDRDIENTLKSIKNLQKALEDVLESCNHESEDMKDVWNDQEVLLNEWESECQLSGNELRCATCSKIMKPKTYIPGFSKPAENDTIYCSCYKHFCQECRSYQGNVTRFLTHQNFHEEEKPYACPDCFRRFPSFRLLEGHTWSFCFHMLKKRVFCCKICQIDGFQDTESIARHFAIMHSTKKIACETCYMVLDTYSEYKRHRDKMHSTVLKFEPIRLMICKLGQCINRYEKYMMHLEKHYGVRKITWLKCPFCSYYNLESKQFLIQFKIHFQIVHLNRLLEIIKPETLKDILPTSLSECLFKEKESLIYDNERFKKQKHIDEKERLGPIVPKILNTRTIPSEDFDQVSENIKSITRNNKSLHSIQSTIKNGMEDNVRSENTGSSIFQTKINKEDNLPKILDVISINDVLLKDQKCSSNIADVEEITVNIKEIQSNADKTKKLRSVINDQSEETCNSPKENIKNDVKCTESDSITPENNGEVQNIITKLKQSNTTITEILKPTIKDSKVPANVSRTSGSLETNLTISNCNNMPNEIETCDNINSTSITKSEQVTALSSSNDSINSENTQKIPKPPPLIRIPEYILENRNHQEVKKIKKKKRTISGNRKTNIKRLCRIALNGPTNSIDVHQDYLCHLCGELINTAWPIISTHFNKRHSDECKLSIVTPRLLRITPEFINGGYKELFSNKKRKSDGTVQKEQSSKKKRKWSTKKHTDSNNSFGEGLYVEQESVEDGKGNFICRRCDQRCANMSDLRKHIASNHRIKGRYLVCLECGENFVVAPSLQMHLKAFHGIEDPISYMNQNSSYAPDNINDLENETKAMIANQCYVCMAVFEDKAAVDKHLRVHGMAFLNRKRIEAQNALKSSDKNIKVNDDKQSFQKESTKTPIKRDNPSNTILEKINATILEEAQ